MQPLVLYFHPGTPNPAKVIIILEELSIPYETRNVENVKGPEYLAINPNGRVPALTDPNTDITLWESNAIIIYLIDEYDKENKINYASSPEKYQLQQYSYFQASGQGPYFGQSAWFNHLHLTSVPDAKERYGNEIRRVVATLDSILKQRDWLVGDKCTWADLAWVPWNVGIDFALAKDKGGPVKFSEDEFPAYKGWMERMRAKESVKKVLAMPR